MGKTHDLVSYIIGARYEDLPEQAIDITKRNILDILAVLIAGSSADGLEALVKLAKAWGGREEATVPIYGGKIPAPNAALVNCTMARARDFDPAHDVVAVHTHATIVPSALILAEYSKMFKSKLISGKDFILAITLGADLHYRLRLAAGKANLRKGGAIAYADEKGGVRQDKRGMAEARALGVAMVRTIKTLQRS